MPPVTTKQTPTGANGYKPRAGSLLSKAIPVNQVDDSFIHMILYGRNRVGKTTLACQFPKPLLLVGVEATKTGGALSVKNVQGVRFLRLRSLIEVEHLGRELEEDNPFKTVVIDSGTSLEEIALAEVCGWDKTADLLRFGKVTQEQYTERAERTRKVLRIFVDLSCHLVVTANEKDHNPPEGRKGAIVRGMQAESFFGPSLGSGNVKWVMDTHDYICQLYIDKEVREVRTEVAVNKKITEEIEYVETGRFVRKLRTLYHPNFAAGFRSPTPSKVPEFIEEPTWEKIVAVARGE